MFSNRQGAHIIMLLLQYLFILWRTTRALHITQSSQTAAWPQAWSHDGLAVYMKTCTSLVNLWQAKKYLTSNAVLRTQETQILSIDATTNDPWDTVLLWVPQRNLQTTHTLNCPLYRDIPYSEVTWVLLIQRFHCSMAARNGLVISWLPWLFGWV